ncbi:hypothetical protein ACET3Z_014034 [Daucus carota]
MDCYSINPCYKYCDNSNEMQHLEKKKKKKSGKKQACGRKKMKLSTDPQSVAARERRHRISERFKILQSLVPGGSKLDTVSMLEEAIVYVKFLKNQLWWLIHYHTHQHQNINFNYNNNNNNNHVVLDEQPSTSFNDLIPYDDRDPRPISTRDDGGLFLHNASSYGHEMAQILEFQDSWLAETSYPDGRSYKDSRPYNAADQSLTVHHICIPASLSNLRKNSECRGLRDGSSQLVNGKGISNSKVLANIRGN